jgi:hypothetical protein
MDCVYGFLNNSGFKEVGLVGKDRFQKRVSRLTPRAARPKPREGIEGQPTIKKVYRSSLLLLIQKVVKSLTLSALHPFANRYNVPILVPCIFCSR